MIPTTIQSPKKSNSPISPKGILAYSCKKEKRGELSARYNEKKKIHHNAIKEIQSLYLFNMIFLLFFFFPKIIQINNKSQHSMYLFFLIFQYKVLILRPHVL